MPRVAGVQGGYDTRNYDVVLGSLPSGCRPASRRRPRHWDAGQIYDGAEHGGRRHRRRDPGRRRDGGGQRTASGTRITGRARRRGRTAVLAEELDVVRHDDDDRAVERAAPVERVEHAAEQMIGVEDARVVHGRRRPGRARGGPGAHRRTGRRAARGSRRRWIGRQAPNLTVPQKRPSDAAF